MMIVTRITVGLVGLFFAIVSVAQEPDSTALPSLPPDIRLVIDVSGSMKRNDPNNLRQPAIELLVQLLPDNSRAGVWTFGKWINMLVPHKPVTTQWREAAQDKAQDINSVGLYTNIGEALEKSAYDVKSANNKYKTSIILLTDGMVDIDKSPEVNKREWRRIVDDVLPKLSDAGITIHTIALSDNADRNLMNKLSLTSGGMAEVAHTADDLMRIFLKTFDAAVPSEQVPLTDNQFVIDSSVEEFTALIFRNKTDEQTALIGPDGVIYSDSEKSSDVKWYRDGKYDLITVKRPLEGEWGVQADMAPDSRITVVSNLNLRVKPLPLNVFDGQVEALNFFLQEDGKIIDRPEFLSLMTIDASMEAGNDEFDLTQFWVKALSDESVPSDGRYHQELPAFNKDGIYQVSVVVDGKTFIRQFNHQFTVRQEFGAEVKHVFIDGKTEYVLIANSFNQNIDIPNTQVVATIISPEGRKKIRPLTATDLDTWKATLLPDYEGEYKAQIKIKGLYTDGNAFESSLNEISFHYSLDGGFVEEETPFFEEEPVVSVSATPVPTAAPTEAIEQPEPADGTEADNIEASPSESVPMWMIYSILGVGNLLLLGLGIFAYKKMMGKNDDVLDQFSDENIEQAPAEDKAEGDSEDEALSEASSAEDEAEEEPPMEDLEPVMDQLTPDEDDDLDPEPAMEALPDPVAEAPIDESTEELDDLDSMADELPEEDQEQAEDDDMVADMLKAQGLDLAEDELDEAISTLIDDLDDDDDMDEDEPKG